MAKSKKASRKKGKKSKEIRNILRTRKRNQKLRQNSQKNKSNISIIDNKVAPKEQISLCDAGVANTSNTDEIQMESASSVVQNSTDVDMNDTMSVNDVQKEKNSSKHIFDRNLRETDIGVTEYISKLPGFTGSIKSRFSDFHVNEINPEGQVAKLTDFTTPIVEKQKIDCGNGDEKYPVKLLPLETWTRIEQLLKDETEFKIVEVDVSNLNKQQRSHIHISTRNIFENVILTSTITKDDKKYITFKKMRKKEKIDDREEWPKSYGGEFVYFLVHKENMDTIEANIQISHRLKMRPSNFGYAGVKDRRAETTQWFSVRKVRPEKLLECAKSIRNVHIGNFSFKKCALTLGALSGNRFRIAIRNVTAEDSIINDTLESLKNHGFINYYGLQRFGNDKAVPTYTIGLALIKGNWKAAIKLILMPREQNLHKHLNLNEAKLIYEKTESAKLACKKLMYKDLRTIEGKLLNALAKGQNNDYVNALEKIPRNVRALYIHSYQSLIWNKAVSYRIKEFGLNPIVGDLVLQGDVKPSNLDVSEEMSDEIVKLEIIKKVTSQHIKVLSEEDLSKYTIYDVVLPLPGYDIIYPANSVRTYYSTLLEADGLTLSMPRNKNKSYAYGGTYRKIIERATNCSWKIMRYENDTDVLILSDFEEMNNAEPLQDNPGAKNKALILDFCLSSSCYATMALREVMKMDTSVQTQINFGNSLLADENEVENTANYIDRNEISLKELKNIVVDNEVGTKIKPTLQDSKVLPQKRSLDPESPTNKRLKLLQFI